MRSITGGIVAFIAGLCLAGATAYGVVKAQEEAGTAQNDTTSNVSYGTNN